MTEKKNTNPVSIRPIASLAESIALHQEIISRMHKHQAVDMLVNMGTIGSIFVAQNTGSRAVKTGCCIAAVCGGIYDISRVITEFGLSRYGLSDAEIAEIGRMYNEEN